MTKHCIRCLLPERAPQADLDAQPLCAFCRGERPSPLGPWQERRAEFEKDLSNTLKAVVAERPRRRSPYDALVCLSGGKDSLYLLYRLQVEWGLRVLAYTTDINIPPEAWANIHRAVRTLGVDHLVYRPSEAFYQKLFRYLLGHQEARGAVYTLSYVYAPLFEGDALREATDQGIPLVFAGYSPGQPEPDRMLYEFSRDLIEKTDWTPPHLRACGEFSKDELARFWNPAAYPAGRAFPRYMAPFHAWPYDQAQVMKTVLEKGLVANARYASPVRSNYPIQWLLMFSDLRQFGYNPYAPEFSALIREGKASLWQWRVMYPLVDFMIRRKILLGRNVRKSLDWLNLSEEELRVSLPRGAYDPPNLNQGYRDRGMM